jgi:hypothetical protein
MTADEKRESLDSWRDRVRAVLNTKTIRAAGEKIAQGFGKIGEKLGSAGG